MYGHNLALWGLAEALILGDRAAEGQCAYNQIRARSTMTIIYPRFSKVHGLLERDMIAPNLHGVMSMVAVSGVTQGNRETSRI